MSGTSGMLVKCLAFISQTFPRGSSLTPLGLDVSQWLSLPLTRRHRHTHHNKYMPVLECSPVSYHEECGYSFNRFFAKHTNRYARQKIFPIPSLPPPPWKSKMSRSCRRVQHIRNGWVGYVFQNVVFTCLEVLPQEFLNTDAS